MPPRKAARARDSPSDSESPEPQPPRSKRRTATWRATPPKRSRTSDRLRSNEGSTPNLRSTRSASQSTILQTPNSADIPRKRQMARRTGGPPSGQGALPPVPTASGRPRTSGPYVEIVSRARRKTSRIDLTAETEEDEESEEDAVTRRARLRRERRARRATASEDEGHYGIDMIDFEEEEPTPRTRRSDRQARHAASREEGSDNENYANYLSDDDFSVGAAGPGPRTTRNRQKKLQGVPQPSPSVFKRLMPPKHTPQTSQMESIDDPDSSPASSPPPETQLSQPRRRKMAIVDGIEMEVFEDDETDEQSLSLPPAAESDEQHICYWANCRISFKTSDELSTHIATHAALFRTRAVSPAPTPSRHSVARSTSARSSQGEASKTLDFLTTELEATRAQVADFKMQLENAKSKQTEVSDKAKAAESLRAQVLAAARAEFSKQLADAQAGFEKKLQAAKAAHESEQDTTREELQSTRGDLEKKVEEVSELEAIVKATETELIKRNTTIDELQAKLQSASDDADPASATTALSLPDDAPAEEQIQERDGVIAALRKELKRAKKSHKTTKGDLAFMREQYEVASSSAVQEVNRAKELDAQVTKLREQLTLGLKQRDLFNSAAIDAATSDAEQARSQLILLLEQSRRTDDAIRRKAAQHHQLTRTNQELEVELHQARSKAHDLGKRNDELSSTNADLRARLMGVYDKVDESSDDDDEPAPGFAMPTLVPDDIRLAEPAADPTLAGDAPLWQCKWLVEDRLCGLYFDTREELDGHGQGVHICALEAS